MAETSRIRELVKKLIVEVLNDMETVEGKTFNKQGVVSSVNSDFTVNVQTADGLFPNVGTPRRMVKGENVVVITADGKKVAV